MKKPQFSMFHFTRFALAFFGLAALTSAASAAQPFATTQPAIGATGTAATLTGMVSPNSKATVAWFRWGSDINYGNLTATTSAGNGNGVVRVTNQISGLLSGSVYHYQLVASNSDGVVFGADQTLVVTKTVWVWGNNYSGQTTPPPFANGLSKIAAGGVHNLALDVTGNVIAWGDNLYGQSTVPAALANSAVTIAAGYYHSLAVKTDGTVSAWGNNLYKQTTVPGSLASVVAVTGGYYHSVALTSTGKVVAWGQNSFGQTNVPAAASNIVAIAAGGNHNLALRNDGIVVGWGDNSAGQLNIPALTGVVAIAAGGLHSMALLNDGSVIVWGDSSVGQTFVPSGLTGVIAIAAGENHCEALKSDGTTVGWGYDFYGQTDTPAFAVNLVALSAGGDKTMGLGFNTAPLALNGSFFGAANTPLTVTLTGSDHEGDALTFKIAQLPAAGTLYQYNSNFVYGAAIVAPNTVVTDPGHRVIYVSGPNGIGNPYTSFQFVANDGSSDSLPGTITISLGGSSYAQTEPPGIVGLTAATLRGLASANFSAATAWFDWGGSTGYTNSTTPQDVGTNGGVFYLSRALNNLQPTVAYHYRLVVSNATGVTYGADQIIGVGQKTFAFGDDSLHQCEVDVTAGRAVAVAAGSGHSLAILTNNTGVGWGDNSYNQSSVPSPLTNLIQVAAGDLHSVVLQSNGVVAAFGDNTYGQTNVPFQTKAIAIAAGSYHNLALSSNGTVIAWGANSFGQAVVPANVVNAVGISAGFGHSMALLNDGTVVCWGDNTYGQTNVPANLHSVIAISAGDNFSLALKGDGTLVGWGDNSANQITIPAFATNVTAISAGGAHCLALRADGALLTWGFDGFGQIDIPFGLTNVISLAAGQNHSVVIAGNGPPVAFPQTITSPQTTNLPIVLSGMDPDGDPISAIITSLPTFGALYQNNNGARGVAILNTNTPVTDPNNQVIFVPASGAKGTPYATFQFALNDGFNNSRPATITVNITGQIVSTNTTTPSAPFAATTAASQVDGSGAVLHGMASANLNVSSAWFEWGATTNYGNLTAGVTLATNGNVKYISMSISNLLRGVGYHYRLVVSNQAAIAKGGDQIFGVAKDAAAVGDDSFQQIDNPGDLPNNAIAISAGYFHTLAVKADGTGESWGDNSANQLGLVTPGIPPLTQLTGGDLHTLALFADGTVQAAGDNTYGQSTVPPNLSGVMAIASGGYHNLALTTNGIVVAWGANNLGQTNVPGANNIVAVAAGFAHSMALRNDGALLIWGDNTYGQQNVPDSATNLVSIAAGRYFCLALRKNGTLVGWGDNAAGQLNFPASATNIIAIAAGNSHSVALRSDGRVIAWGLNNYGQTNTPSVNTAMGIAAGEYHTVILTADTAPGSLDQIVNYPSPASFVVVGLTGFDPDAADAGSLTFRIVGVPVLGTLYQYNTSTGNRGPAILTTNVPVTDPSGQVIFVPNAGGSGAPYATFQFVVNDGVYDSAPGTVTINIAGKPTVTTLAATIVNRTNATLSGLISPNQANSIGFFQWGLTTNYGNTTLRSNISSLLVSTTISTNITNLTAAATYHYRLIGSNSFGTNAGADLTFIPPVADYSLTNTALLNRTNFQFKFTGASNATYSVWGSTNLTNWIKLGTATQPTPGNFLYQDTLGTNSSRRFYKAIWP